ncbi:unnamed protein product [Rhizophagus irregularis]|uniref:Uncharacterized protein n=1 Tax=Rhizophagus irregularis TaxID=588596 RepID=A0A2I1GW94_9GLOM|nr:hypothetical protein RhiirA4_424123 [Rhizophagus irregularis]CAB4413185.1 unnamed protein product [Rhizophagus irregularis]
MAPKRKSKIVPVNATSKKGSKQSISKNRSSLNTIEARSKKDKSVEEMSSDSENVAEEIEQELTITKGSLPNTEEARFKKDNFVLVVLPELETVAERSEQEQSMLRKRSLPNPAEVRSKKKKTIQEIPSEIIDLETVAEGSEQQGQENLRFFNEITNENIPALIPDRSSIRNNLESYTEFEIANFVADHPSILELANILKESKSVTAGNSGNCKLPAFSFQKEKAINNKLLIEELKLLFLKCRKPNSHVFNAIICGIYPDLKDKLHQETAKNIHHECVLKMADYRHKYVKKISEMVNAYIKNEENDTVEEYVGNSWRNILSMHLRAIQKDEFESSKDDQEQLKKFVIESFKIVHNYELNKDGAAIDLSGDIIKKTLDRITLEIKVPSVSKHNIVDNLDLKKLLR